MRSAEEKEAERQRDRVTSLTRVRRGARAHPYPAAVPLCPAPTGEIGIPRRPPPVYLPPGLPPRPVLHTYVDSYQEQACFEFRAHFAHGSTPIYLFALSIIC